jgi:hypothetical protein
MRIFVLVVGICLLSLESLNAASASPDTLEEWLRPTASEMLVREAILKMAQVTYVSNELAGTFARLGVTRTMIELVTSIGENVQYINVKQIHVYSGALPSNEIRRRRELNDRVNPLVTHLKRLSTLELEELVSTLKMNSQHCERNLFAVP